MPLSRTWLPLSLLLLSGFSPTAQAQAPEGEVRVEGPALVVRWFPEQPARGDPLVVEVRAPKGWKVGATFLSHRLRFFPWGETRRALAPISVTTRPGTHPLAIILTRGGGKDREVVQRIVRVPVADAEFERSELRVNPRFTSPPKEARVRIRKERARIKKAWRKTLPRRLWRGEFQRPMTTEKTGTFGTERVFNDRVASRHLGLDLDGKTGDRIRATARGRVVLAGHLFYTGRCVFIDHGLGLFSVYFHLSKLEVKEGQWVDKGQVIGRVGRSGRVTGPHLHFGAKLMGVYVKPTSLFELDLADESEPIAAPK